MISAVKKIKTLPTRSQVKPADTWNLDSLLASDAAWEAEFKLWEAEIDGYEQFRGNLDDDAKTLAACLRFDNDFDRRGERLGTYAFLKTAEDAANSDYQRMIGRYRHAASRASQAASYIRPEIMAIKSATMEKMLAAPNWPNSACCSNGCCATSRTRSAAARKSCSPCRARCRKPRTRSFAS